MINFPIKLTYQLNRKQRLIPHFCLWFPQGMIVLLLPFIFIGSLFFKMYPLALISFLTILFSRNFWIGLFEPFLNPIKIMDIEIEQNGLGFLIGKERFYIFLDGIISINKYLSNIWTILHHNGTVINIPTHIINEEQINYIKQQAEKRTDPEQIKKVIERGKMIHQLEQEIKKEKES